MNSVANTSPNLTGLWVGLVTYLIVGFFTSLGVASAAQKKGRSYGSFFWLSFLFSPFLPALVVAARPFSNDDPRHPRNKYGTGGSTQTSSPQLHAPASTPQAAEFWCNKCKSWTKRLDADGKPNSFCSNCGAPVSQVSS